MTPVAKAIRKATGLTMNEFCEQHLNSKVITFSVRLRNNTLYPIEYLYICLLTGCKFEDLFPASFQDSLLLKGDPTVVDKVKAMLAAEGGMEKLSKLMGPVKIEIAPNMYDSTMAKSAVDEVVFTTTPTENKSPKVTRLEKPKHTFVAKTTIPKPPEPPKDDDEFKFEETYNV